ncbi:hypothetical protein DASB73_037220 [Starmerella bacillaris]|uniref:Uncharacterized protein n=1 Tax=Starmerella bacillaris TaxID=1247836 RepID=A0AAV5RQG1_STABA|nr:hypothetical protein DASB73_037220 [Starmerella bacillaris]
MSPPTVVMDDRLVKPHTECPLVQLVQYECEYRVETEGFDCVPFKRMFRECPSIFGPRRYEEKHEPEHKILHSHKRK